MPPGVGVSGLESDGGDQFFGGGGKSGNPFCVTIRPSRSNAIPACDIWQPGTIFTQAEDARKIERQEIWQVIDETK